MERRLILAVALSFLVLLTWSALVTKTQHIDNKEVIQKKSEIAVPAPASLKSQTIQEIPTETPLGFSAKKIDLLFMASWAALTEATFKDYQSHKIHLKNSFYLKNLEESFTKEITAAEKIVFSYKDINKEIKKEFIFSNLNYDIQLTITIKNLTNNLLRLNTPLVLGTLNFAQNNKNGNAKELPYQEVVVALDEKTWRVNGRKELSFGKIKFLALRNRYFCAILEPLEGRYSADIRKINANESEVSLIPEERTLKPGEEIKQKFQVYLGPQDLKLMSAINPSWGAVINFGVFDLISHILLQLLELLHKITHNWGWSIVVLSIVIYLILYPLSLKQLRSMKEMQALQPHILELQKMYKDNPQKLNKEIMVLYREHKVNPFGGCLPLLLQLPIFFALYQALNRAIALKGAKFLWIKDLSESDRLFILPNSLPVIGNEINILPILMTIGMFIQQKTSMGQVTGGQAEQQKLMLIIMPLMFGFIFYHMPSGLVLYWFINSSLTLLNQLKIRRKK